MLALLACPLWFSPQCYICTPKHYQGSRFSKEPEIVLKGEGRKEEIERKGKKGETEWVRGKREGRSEERD